MYGGGGGGQWPGQQQQQTGGYMHPQATGYMGMQSQSPMMTGMPPQQQQQQSGFLGAQPTGMGMGMGMMPQATGFGGMGMGQPGGPGLGGMRQTSYGQQTGMMAGNAMGQQRFLSPQNLQAQPTGMMQSNSPGPQFGGGLQPQATGYHGGPLGMQATGLMPQMTGLPMDPRMQLMSAQFLPGSVPFSGAPVAGNMNFTSAQMQPSSFQSSIQNLSQQQQGSKEPKIPWALSKDEKKSYDSIFRAWDQKGSGFLGGDVAIELFGQSGLERDKLMQIWHLSDTENRGKLNLAEFHVAMGLIYRALNGNDIPEHLPQELIPPSAKDLSDSVDFLKDLLKRDANVRQTTALNLPESGSNSGVNYGKTRSFHENPIQKQDATAYKHTEEASTGYKSSARHLDRRTVRYGGESPADDLSEMKRQLAQTQRMLDSQADRDDEDDREVEKEMEELRFRIKRVQDDIDYYNRRGGRDATDNRRKAERELLHLMHERLPLLEKRLDEKDKKKREKNLNESRDRDRRNETSLRGGRYSDYDDHSRSQTPTQRDHDRNGGGARDDRDNRNSSDDRAPPPAPHSVPEITKPAPAPPAPAAVAAISAPAPPPPSNSGPPKNMTPEQRTQWVRAEAQRRVAERMRSLGLSVPSSSSPAADNSVEDRLAAEKAEAEARTAQADAEASAREEARRARLEEQKIEREKAAVSTVKSELKEQEKGENPPPQMVLQAAREQVEEEEEMLKRREEVLKKEKEERLARFQKLEEEEAEAKRQEDAFKQRQAQFSTGSSTLPAPVRKGKSGPPPPPPNRSRAPPPPAPPASSNPISPPQAISPVASIPPTVPKESSPTAQVTSPSAANASTNPFFRMHQQPNGAAPGGTNPFYRQQQASEASKPAFAENLPTPQRTINSTIPASATVPPTISNTTPARRAPDDDDDWGESDHGDQDEEDPDGPGSTSRATRQNLAAALFSNLVSTPPQSASPAPPAAPPPPPASAAPVQVIADSPQAPPPPPAPAAPKAATIPVPTGGSADRGALLGEIRGGLSLKKAKTNDRSGAGLTGKVIGDASAPVQTYVPPPTPPAVEEEEEEHFTDASSDLNTNPNRQSVDWAGSLAAEQMHAHQKASAIPDEPSVLEEQEESEDDREGPEDLDGPGLKGNHVVSNTNGAALGGGGSEEANDFDLSRTIRVRTLYPYEAQRDEDLGFIENSVLLAHPAKDESSDWWYGSIINGSSSKKGTFPKAYIESIENPKIAKALFDFEGSSPEEMNLTADQELRIVDDADENWWKVVDKEDRILIVPATYVEMVNGASVGSVQVEQVKSTEDRSGNSIEIDEMRPSSLLAGNGNEEEAILQAKIQSEKDERERSVAVSREEKDLRRAIQMSKADFQTEGKQLHEDDDDDEIDGEESDSGYSTTGWTSSEDDDDDDEIDGRNDGLEGQESEEAQQRRVAERLRVLEAAGILVVQDGSSKERQSKDEDSIDTTMDASKHAEHLLLHRRSTSKKKKPRPERPTRTIGEQRKRKEKPGRPSRPPPPPPVPIEKEPEEQMDDAYERFMKLSKEVRNAQQENKFKELPDEPIVNVVSTSSSSPPPSLTKSTSSTASSLLNTLKSMSSRRASAAGVERKPTPTISGPIRIQRNDSPSIGGQHQPGSSMNTDSLPDKEMGNSENVIGNPSNSTTSWSSMMASEVLTSIPDQERKRQESIFELISTESTHVRDIQIIVDVFFNAMQPLLQAKAATVIFGNIEEVLLAAVSLLSDLETRQRSTQMYITQIGDILEQHMTGMSVYIPYCVNQESASHILTSERTRNTDLNGLLSRLRSEHPSARGLDLSHFLLAPMQRLTRYPLLIGQILRYTNEEDVGSDEYQSLKNAMRTAQELLDTTNESIRQRESDDRLRDLTEKINATSTGQNGLTQVKLDLTQSTRWMGQRKILKEEVLLKQKSGRKICVVLCNDFILLLSGRRSTDGQSNADQYLYKMPMPLEELVVRDVPNGLKGRDDLAFQLVHQGREKVNIRCSSARACHQWMHRIDSARSDCLAAANKIQKRTSKQRQQY